MNPWHYLKKTRDVLRYHVDFLEKSWRHDLLWSQVEDRTRIMEALTQSLARLQSSQERLEHLDRVVENMQMQKRREESLLLASLQRSSELERRIAQMQKDMQKLGEGQDEVEDWMKRHPGFGPQALVGSSPEAEILASLHDVLPHRMALDIGAHHGAVSALLLDRGFRVHAFEPNPELYDALVFRFKGRASFQAHRIAVGDEDGEGLLHLVSNAGAETSFPDPTLYSTLRRHPLPEGLEFGGQAPVPVRNLASLHRSGVIPPEVDLVKIDAEGWDLLVLAGMGDRRYEVVMAEFWSPDAAFGSGDGKNHLPEMAALMKGRGYPWNIVLACRDGEYGFCHIPNSFRAPEKSWGNVLFFQNGAPYRQALEWCRRHLPAGVGADGQK